MRKIRFHTDQAPRTGQEVCRRVCVRFSFRFSIETPDCSVMRKRDLLTPRVERKHSGAMYAELSVCMCVWLLVIALVHGGKYTNDSGTSRRDVCGVLSLGWGVLDSIKIWPAWRVWSPTIRMCLCVRVHWSMNYDFVLPGKQVF